MDIQTIYQDTIKYATAKHLEKNQKVPGSDLPYVVHLSNVTMETIIAGFHTENFDTAFAIQVALLHDTIEDTSATFEELASRFGINVAYAVAALTKNKSLPKDQQMRDSLYRIKLLQKEVWAVKLADRITNLQPPPSHWDNDKRFKYQQEARYIFVELQAGNEYLAKRIESQIEEYCGYISIK
jgi:guanosine-3',5'-bis(diphosphate) 3'-pyrophosphohydrolase